VLVGLARNDSGASHEYREGQPGGLSLPLLRGRKGGELTRDLVSGDVSLCGCGRVYGGWV
jgi:hypothetical protein